MLSAKMQEALNKQLNAEYYSSYLYLSISAYFQSAGLSGFSSWMRMQTQEELIHATKFYDYISERGGRVNLLQIQQPPVDWDSPVAVFEYACQHEHDVTQAINNLVNLAIEEKDHATNNFLQWFVSEQVEEEASFAEVSQKLKLMSDAPGGMFMIDQEMAKRVFTPPATSSAA